MGFTLLVGALALVVLPALPWFSAPTPRGSVSASGLEISGILWLVPVLGMVVALSGVSLLVAPTRRAVAVARWAGPLAALAGALALAAVVWAGGDPQAVLTVHGRLVVSDLTEHVRRESASWMATGAAMGTLLVGGLAGLAAWRH